MGSRRPDTIHVLQEIRRKSRIWQRSARNRTPSATFRCGNLERQCSLHFLHGSSFWFERKFKVLRSKLEQIAKLFLGLWISCWIRVRRSCRLFFKPVGLFLSKSTVSENRCCLRMRHFALKAIIFNCYCAYLIISRHAHNRKTNRRAQRSETALEHQENC